MRKENQDSGLVGSDEVDLDRREVLASLAKYSATVAGASAVVLTASASVSAASVSGGGPGRPGGDTGRPSLDPGRPGGQNPGNDKPVGRAPFDGRRGEVPSGRNG